MHALLAVHGGEGFAQHEAVSEQERADVLTGAAIHDLGVNLRFRITGKIEDAEFAGLIRASGNADFLGPEQASLALGEERPVGGRGLRVVTRQADHGTHREVAGFAELKLLCQVDFPSQRFAGRDFHRTEELCLFRGDRVAVAVFHDEIEPLEAPVTLKDQIPAGVVGEGDDCDDGLTCEVLLLGKPDGSRNLGLCTTRAHP